MDFSRPGYETEEDRQLEASLLEPDNLGSLPEMPSVFITSPELDLVNQDLPLLAEDFQTYVQLVIQMAKSLVIKVHRPSIKPEDYLYDPI